MLWKFRKSTITIPSELHDKMRKCCPPLDEVQSEVIRVRRVQKKERKAAKNNPDNPVKYRV
ncbi:MAG TPA: hypothetical protein VK463_17820 [Desulfomonilaceae bacterium]|nr:hypothetical protein [Desulfomonilaceae bacterium]